MELVRSVVFRTEDTEETEGNGGDTEELWGRTAERVTLIARLT
jgi:hypothetical protein